MGESTVRWIYPKKDVKTVQHKARQCEAVERDANGKKLRDANGKTVKKMVVVPAYRQTIQ